jgi:hypothetical protein
MNRRSHSSSADASCLPVELSRVVRRPAGFASTVDEGGGIGAATVRTAPKPSTHTRRRARTRTESVRRQDRERGCSPLEMLGYDQPRDSGVNGVAQMPTRCALVHLRSSPQIVRTWVQHDPYDTRR